MMTDLTVEDLVRLDRKVKAIEDKDSSKILVKGSHIPELGTLYSKTSLDDWLAKRVSFLNSLKTISREEVEKIEQTEYARMCATCQWLLDNDPFKTGEYLEKYLDPCSIDHWRLMMVRLTRFVLGVYDLG